VKNRPNAPFELYNLATDEAEERNVVAEHPEVMQKIESICREAHTPERVFQPAEREGVNDYVK
jgi:hypothetical protein